MINSQLLNIEILFKNVWKKHLFHHCQTLNDENSIILIFVEMVEDRILTSRLATSWLSTPTTRLEIVWKLKLNPTTLNPQPHLSPHDLRLLQGTVGRADRGGRQHRHHQHHLHSHRQLGQYQHFSRRNSNFFITSFN